MPGPSAATDARRAPPRRERPRRCPAGARGPRGGRCRCAPATTRWYSASSYSASSNRMEKVRNRSPLTAPTERGDERAVQPARQVASHRDVGAQHAQPDRILAARSRTSLGRLGQRAPEAVPRRRSGSAASRKPVAVRPRPTIADVARLEFRRRRAKTDWGGHDRPEGEGLGEARPGRAARGMAGSPAKMAFTSLANQSRPRARRDTGGGRRAGPGPAPALRDRVPQRDGELPVEAREAPLAPGLPGVDDHLGVAPGAEAVAERHSSARSST